MKKDKVEKGGGSHRVARVEREIRDVVSTYLIAGFRGDLPGIVSVSRVQASPDLKSARVYVTLMSTMPQPGEMDSGAQVDNDERDRKDQIKMSHDRKAAIEELRNFTHEVQHEVAKRLQMRFTPKLQFFYDEGFENALRVEKILREIGEQNAVKNPKSASEPDPSDNE